MVGNALRDARKYQIIQVGGFDKEGYPNGWRFNGAGSQHAAIWVNPETGRPEKWGGWSLEELREIAASWGEMDDDPRPRERPGA